MLLCLPLALAGCGGESSETAGGEAAAASSGESFAGSIQAGRWRVDSTTSEGGQQTEYMCVTAEQAASGSFLRGELPDGCAVQRDEVANGRIDFALSCGSEGRVMTSSMTGSYDATSYRTEMSVELGAGDPLRAISEGTFEGADCQPDDFRMTVD